MNRIRFRSLCCLLFLTCAVATAQDTTGVGGFRGDVVDETAKPLSGVSVCLKEISRCATTDEAGRFHFEQLRSAVYTLNIQSGTASRIEAGSIDVRAGLEFRLPD